VAENSAPGMTADYKDKQSEIGKWLRYTFGLLYLNPSEVGDCFAFDLYDLIPSDSRVEKFADYLLIRTLTIIQSFPHKFGQRRPQVPR
jgi:hypothetical protein